MKKLFATLALMLFTAACAQTGPMQNGMMKDGCKCCEGMMKEGKECCCKGMMSDSGTKMDIKDGSAHPMCAKMKEGMAGKEKSVSKPVKKALPDEHEQHH